MRRAPPLLLAALLLSACASGHAMSQQPAPAKPAPSIKAIAAQRERAAERQAARLLRSIPLPSGAIRLQREPAGTTDLAYSNLGTSVSHMTAERHAFWRVPGAPGAVLAFVRRHLPPGLEGGSGGRMPGGYRDEVFYGRVDGGPRGVSIAVAPLGNGTAFRLDVGAGWIYPRPQSEVLPAGVREIDIHGGDVTRTVARAADVARIVRWFDELNAVQPSGSVSCLLNISTQVSFVFRSGSGAVLARAVASSRGADGCDPIELTVGGKRQPGLIDAPGSSRYAFINRVQRLLGVCFAAGPHGGRVSPTCNKAWAGHVATQVLHRFVPPTGAQGLPREPQGDGGLLRSPETVSGGRELVDVHRFWRVRGSLASVEAFVRAHSHGGRLTATGTAGGPGVPANRSLTFTYVARNILISSRQLEVTLVSLPGAWTGIRADAQAVWIYPRRQSQMAPEHVQAIDVRGGSVFRHVTDRRLIERISLRFDRLEVAQPGAAFSCPAIGPRGPKVTVAFLSGDVVAPARAVAPGTGISTECYPIRFSIGGRETSLIGADFVQWLQGVLGVRFR